MPEPADQAISSSLPATDASRGRTSAQRELEERLEQATGIKQRTVEIRDARGIRALAHEARQQVIDVMFGSPESFTSTQLAQRTGLTPSAMSYHLRALERWGVVERVAGAEDGRNRPWRAAGTSLTIIGGASPATAGAIADRRRRAFEDLERRSQAQSRLPVGDRERYIGLSQGEYWLNDEELDYLALAVQRSLVELAERGWSDTEGDGRTRVATLWSILPAETAGTSDLSAGDDSDAATQTDETGFVG